MDIVSVQSRVVYGYVGNSAAVPIIQRAGINAWPVDTVVMPHHPGHGRPDWRHLTPPSDLQGLLRSTIRMLARPAALLIGYMNSGDQGTAILETWTDNPDHGPVYVNAAFGDDAEGLFVDPSVVAFHRERSLHAATTMILNRFELAYLTGMEVDETDQAISAARVLITDGPATILATSVPHGPNTMANVLVSASDAWQTTTPRRPLRAKGTGDIISAAFTCKHANDENLVDSLSFAASVVAIAVEQTVEADADEMVMPECLDEIGRAPDLISVIRVLGG